METGSLLVDIALAVRMMIPACENATSQKGNCFILGSHLKLLKLLFDELRQSKFPLSEATITAFVALQLTLKRVKDVLGRCSKGRSKLYSLLRSPQIVDQFQDLNGEMERILSASRLVLPRVSKQAQYMAENCVQELRKAIYSTDVLEEQIRQEIETLLREHRGGKKASREKLDKIAGCLGLNSKDEISEELNALEKARSEAGTSKDKSEEEYIDQVISLFMQLADDNFDGGDVKAEIQEVQIPADFRCPLSLELMYDPVIVASGQTYERAYIQHWLDQGNTRCPKTGKPLVHVNLIPNYTVKALIVSWCQTNGVPLPKVDGVKSTNWLPPTFSEVEEAQEQHSQASDAGVLDTDCDERATDFGSSAGVISKRKDKNGVYDRKLPTGPVVRVRSSTYSSELSGEVEALGLSPSRNSPDHFPIFTRQMQSAKQKERKSYKSIVYTEGDKAAEACIERLVQELTSTDPDVLRTAASELRLMTKNSIEDRIRIAHAGGIRHLIALLSSGDSKTQENAVTALLNLSLNENNKAEIADAGAIDPLIEVLKSGTSDARENAAATLCSLSVEDYKEMIGARGAIPPLVDLLKSGTPRGKKDAATALHNLSLFRENKARIVAAGGVRPLINLICEPRMGMVDRAVDVLVTLSSIPEGRLAIGEEGGIPPLVEVVEAGSPLAKERAAAALLQLCTNNPRYRNTTLQEGAVPPLYILSQIGTSRAKEKAAGILRLFREQRQVSMSRHPGRNRLM